jgi:hypothetical protein
MQTIWTTCHVVQLESITLMEEVQAISDALDRVRRLCTELGIATLLAEVHEVPSEIVRAALDEIARAADQALRTLHDA